MSAKHLANLYRATQSHGTVMITTLIFMGVFMMLFVSLMDYLLMQYRWVGSKTEQERALEIAEAGIEYYRWHLSHFPNDLQDGTGTPGPYVHTYEDPEEGPIGQFSLEIGGDLLCGKVQVVQATSTGWTFKDPKFTRTIAVSIARPTVADYSYIVDANVWAGSSRTIVGPYHTNGVVRMDANNLSAVTSKVGTTSCSGPNLGGCSGTIFGVYGTGSHPEWWRHSQPDIPFSNFDYDFDTMEKLAQDSGIYLKKISDDATLFGYYLELKNNKTVDIYRVTSINWTSVTTPDSQTINTPEILGDVTTHRQFIENRAIPQTCPIVYASDRVWLEGQVSGKVTVVANATTTLTPDMFLQDNITYSTTTGADGLTALSEGYLLIPLDVPTDMTISGIFFSQKASYGRASYGNMGVTYNPKKARNSLSTNGTIISKGRTGTAWYSGTNFTQGFQNRFDNYDRTLAKSPPPLTPFASPDFRFIEWREVK